MAKPPVDPSACAEYNALTRRMFLSRSSAAALALSAPAWLPRVTYAQSENSARDVIVHIFLRGGMDGLSMVPPYGEAAYYALRPTIAVPRPDSSSANKALDLNGFFGLPPAMGALLPAYQAGHALFVHATGSIDPSRSHFDAQHFMETGEPGSTLTTGWLGRHLASTSPMTATAVLRAVAFTFGMTETLAGGPDTLPIPDPSNFGLSGTSSSKAARLAWIGSAYATESDPLKSAAANTQQTIAALAALNITGYKPAGSAVYANNSFALALRSTAALIRANIGVEAVQIDLSGWDTHSAQGPLTGGMAALMKTFADGIAAFHADMDGASMLNRITLVAMSEFGRRAQENGSQGVDHGHGNAMLVLGGTTNGGKVLTNWPGLNAGQLYQNQDVQVTTDHRDILSEILSKRLDDSSLDVVFPGYTPVFRNAVRTGAS